VVSLHWQERLKLLAAGQVLSMKSEVEMALVLFSECFQKNGGNKNGLRGGHGCYSSQQVRAN
jgi:hypothetical protein